MKGPLRGAVRRAICLSAIPTWLLAAPAMAQTGEAPAAAQERPETPPPEAGGLDEIVVTARKREENLQNIPIAVSVVSGEQLQKFNVTSVEKLTSLAPQLVVGRSGTGNGAAIGLRGISVNATSISLEQSVAVVIDGVYYSGGRALNQGLFDLSQAEVLKGPQSLFYGKNTTAGALSFTTAGPTRTFSAMARIGYETRAINPYLEGYVSGPVTDNLSLRLAGRYSHQFGGLFENITYPTIIYTRDAATGLVTAHDLPKADDRVSGERSGIVRFTAQYAPSDRFTATVKATYNSFLTNTPNANTVIAFCERGFVQSDPAAPCGHDFRLVQQYLPPDIAATDPLLDRGGGAPYLEYKSINVTGNLAYDTDHFSLTVLPAYTKWVNYYRGDLDFTNAYQPRTGTGPSGGNGTGERSQMDAFSFEARLQTKLDGIFNLMAGGYFQSSELAFQQDNVNPGGLENSAVSDPSLRFLAIRKVSHTSGRTYAAFGQVLLDVTPQLNFTAGLRYTHETNDSTFSQVYVHPSQLSGNKIGTIGANQAWDNFSPEATISWKPVPNVTVYGSYRTGYKSGGFSISGRISPVTTPRDATFAPEKVGGFEGGIKSTLADNQLRLNLDAFNYRYTDLQVDFFDATLVQYLTLNAGKALSRGVELEAEFAPRGAQGLVLRGSLSFLDAKYTSFPYAPCLAGQRPAEGCSFGATPNGSRFFQDLTGEATQQAPRWTGTFGLDYEHAIGGGLKAGLSTNIRYSSSYVTNPFANSEATRFRQGDYATLDMSLRLAEQDDRWQIDVIGKNLTNAFIVSAAFDLTYTGSGTGTAAGVHADGRASVYEPRTIAIQGTVRF